MRGLTKYIATIIIATPGTGLGHDTDHQSISPDGQSGSVVSRLNESARRHLLQDQAEIQRDTSKKAKRVTQTSAVAMDSRPNFQNMTHASPSINADVPTQAWSIHPIAYLSRRNLGRNDSTRSCEGQNITQAGSEHESRTKFRAYETVESRKSYIVDRGMPKFLEDADETIEVRSVTREVRRATAQVQSRNYHLQAIREAKIAKKQGRNTILNENEPNDGTIVKLTKKEARAANSRNRRLQAVREVMIAEDKGPEANDRIIG